MLFFFGKGAYDEDSFDEEIRYRREDDDADAEKSKKKSNQSLRIYFYVLSEQYTDHTICIARI